jgi:hypothetical protein
MNTSRDFVAFQNEQGFNYSLFENFSGFINMSLMRISPVWSNKEKFSETIYKIDSWLTIGLSIVSCILVIVFLVAHIIGQVEGRDHNKETKRSAFKKLLRIEYLVFGYCIVLFFAHFFTLIHKLFIQLVLNNFIVANRLSICLTMAVLKQFFWLLSVIHTNALSIKIYRKLSKSIDTNTLNQSGCIKTAINVFFCIYLAAFSIILGSLAAHFVRQDIYKLEFAADKLNACFLNYPVSILFFFALPIASILVVNFILFIILFTKTKRTLEQSENNETSYFFYKLAILMGFSWIIYIVCIFIMEIFSENFHMQIIIIIGSCQINFQGSLVVICTYSNSILESLSKRKSKTKRTRVVRFNLHINRPNVIYDNRMTAL